MTVSYNQLLKTAASAAILLAGMAVTACVPRHTAPVAVAASNPTITYVYHNDGELLQANDQAAGYCAQYQAGPHLVRYDQGPDGRIAVFECVQGPVGPVAAGPGPVYGAPTQIAYDSYYDDYYGPYYGGYCAQYQAGPHLVRYDQGPDGRIAVFECVQGPVGPVAAGPGPVYGAPTQIAYDSYYDDYYGPYYGGYWGGDGFFYFTDGPGHPYRRDDFHHFRRDSGVGFHGVRTTVVHTG